MREVALSTVSLSSQEGCRSISAQAPDQPEQPERALQQACQEAGAQFIAAEQTGEDDEDWEDVMEDFEDFWMRDPKAETDFEEQLRVSPQGEPTSNPVVQEEVHIEELLDLLSSARERACILNLGDEKLPLAILKDHAEQIQGCSILNMSLKDLTREVGSQLEKWELIVVMSDLKAQKTQAYIRLTKVFNLENVKIFG